MIRQNRQRQRLERRRQFDDVRASYSRRKDISQSKYINNSQNKSPQGNTQSRLTDRSHKDLRKSVYNHLTRFQIAKQNEIQNSKLNKNNALTPRQFDNQKNSKSVSRVRSHSHNNLVCVGCFNKKQADAQKLHKLKEQQKYQQQERSLKNSLIQQDNHRKILQQSIIKHVQSVNEYNKRVAQQKNHEKYRKRIQEQRQFIQEKQKQLQYLKQKQNMREMQNYKREQLKRQLERQMQQAKAKKEQQINTFKNCETGSIIPTQKYSHQMIDKVYEQHRKQLRSQIEQNKRRREMQMQKEREQLKNGVQFQLVTFAQERNKASKEYQKKLREQQIYNFNQKKSRQAQRLKIQHQKRRQEQENRKRLANIEQSQNEKIQNQRRQKIDQYLSDLKKQMQNNKVKRMQELKRLNNNKQTQSLIHHQPISSEHCGNCDKEYPRQFLSQFIDYE